MTPKLNMATNPNNAPACNSPQLIVPENIVLMPLPPYAPELNSVENIWQYLRSNCLSHCVWETYEAILEACCTPRDNSHLRPPQAAVLRLWNRTIVMEGA